MEHLESLTVKGKNISKDTEAANIERSSLFRKQEHVIMLRYLCLQECHNVLDLNWLIHAPHLKILELVRCDLLEQVISEDIVIVKDTQFSNLTSLRLISLNNLRSICRMTLQFPSLKEIYIEGCPNLKKLPFNSQSDALKNLRLCVGYLEWFHQLQ
ncbi:hypothetical protein K1719_032524 [Acacia pycnantha]|nr:hypothetical protein K1719_032524 [Acacia pycnantha]